MHQISYKILEIRNDIIIRYVFTIKKYNIFIVIVIIQLVLGSFTEHCM